MILTVTESLGVRNDSVSQQECSYGWRWLHILMDLLKFETNVPSCGRGHQRRVLTCGNKPETMYGIVIHDDVIKWKLFPHYWPFLRGIHRSPVNSPHKDQWRGALVFSLICAWIKDWLNNGEAGDLRRYRAHFVVTVMIIWTLERQNLVVKAHWEYGFLSFGKISDDLE